MYIYVYMYIGTCRKGRCCTTTRTCLSCWRRCGRPATTRILCSSPKTCRCRRTGGTRRGCTPRRPSLPQPRKVDKVHKIHKTRRLVASMGKGCSGWSREKVAGAAQRGRLLGTCGRLVRLTHPHSHAVCVGRGVKRREGKGGREMGRTGAGSRAIRWAWSSPSAGMSSTVRARCRLCEVLLRSCFCFFSLVRAQSTGSVSLSASCQRFTLSCCLYSRKRE